MKIVFAVTGSSGHVTQVLLTANALSDLGHEIRFITNCENSRVVEEAGYSAYSYCSVSGNQEDFLNKILEDIHKTSLQNYDLFATYADGTDLILGDGHTPCATIFAEANKIPYVDLVITPAHLRESEIKKYFFNNLALVETNQLRNRLGLSSVDNIPGLIMERDSLKIAIFPEEFGGATECQKKIHYTNFPNFKSEPLPNTVADFLYKQKKPIVVTMGSGGKEAIFPKNFWEIIFELGNKHSLIILNHNDVYIKNKNVSFFSERLSYRSLFAEARCVINHGGMGTMATALFSEVPQIAIPQMQENVLCAELFSQVYNTKTILPEDLTIEKLSHEIDMICDIIPKKLDDLDCGKMVIEILRNNKYIDE